MSTVRRLTPRFGRAGARLAVGALVAAAWAPVAARGASGGPDAFGYTWHDGGEPGVAYAWEAPGPGAMDVTVVGDDTTTGFLSLSFPFPYYGSTYSRLAVCSNGWLSFVDDTSTTFTNLAIPTVGEPVGVIAAYWNDLELDARSRVTLEDFGTRAVVTWEDAFDRGDARADNVFQVILHDDGRLVVQVDSIAGDSTGASLGIESPSETTGLQVFRNPAGGIPAPHVVEFRPPATVPNDLDCSAAVPVACGDVIDGTTVGAPSNQAAYGCTELSMNGGEVVHALELATATDLRIVLEEPTGQARVMVLDGCDPNRCLAPAGRVVTVPDAVGSVRIVVDGPAGSEGAYRLFVDCFPVPVRLDCAGATNLACGDIVTGDLAASPSNQDRYWCTPDDLSGAEDVYRIDLATATDLRIDLEAISGDPRLVLLRPCDPSFCSIPPGDVVHLEDATGAWFVAVESAPGEEGEYQLAVTCLQETFDFCTDETYDGQAGATDNGSWTVPGLLYDVSDTHSWAVSVDGGAAIYSHDEACTTFPFTSAGVAEPAGPGLVTWEAPEVRVDLTASPTSDGTCCGLLVTADVTNVDDVPHSYDLRVLHDLAFGFGDGTCSTDVINGGPVEVSGTVLDREAELLPLGADTCEGQVRLFSAEDPATLRGAVEMLPPTPPSDMELLSWESAFDPCAGWRDLVTGIVTGDCLGDSSLLLTWALPAGGGTLAPGESARARWRLGMGCAFSCAVACEDPVLAGPATAVDEDDCAEGIRISWPAATFPGDGNGIYHVHRSQVSAADALTRPPVSPAGGVTGTSWLDATAPANVPVFHAVQAESTDFPGCGDGPLVSGSTDHVEVGPTTDVVAEAPVIAEATAVDIDGCAPDVRLDWTVTFPDAGVVHVHRSTVSFADALAQPPITPAGGVTGTSWTDVAPPANVPLFHVVVAEATDRPGCGDGPAVGGVTDEFEVGPTEDLVAEDPVLGTGSASDPDACTRGLALAWDPATFPASGAGRYHLFRSDVSFADAPGRPPLTPAAGITATSWLDETVPVGVTHWYVVVAEAIELPGCGDGPAVGGTTDALELGTASDSAVERPLMGAATAVELAACTAGVRVTWDAATFPGTGDGVYHVRRSTVSHADALAQPPLTPAGGVAATSWDDPSPPANVSLFYVVQAESLDSPGCGDGPAVMGPTDAADAPVVVDGVAGDVVAGAASVADVAPCDVGVLVSWEAADFPDPGGGRYHVHRSDVSAADALAQPPLTPAAGIATTTWLDETGPVGVEHWYVVVAESTDHPGCGDGPSVGGPADTVIAGAATDLADAAPPTGSVGDVLRLGDGAADGVALDWTGGDAPGAGEAWVVLRSDGDPSGGFVERALGVGPTWRDDAATAPAARPHAFFYDVRLTDACGRLSDD